MAEISNGPDRLVKSEGELTGRRLKFRCNMELHKDMERAWEERETVNRHLEDELRRMKEEAEQAERAQEAERSLLERCKDKIKKDREKKTQLVDRARAMIQEETDRRTELEEQLEKMNKELQRLKHMEKKIERHLRKNLAEEFEERLQNATQGPEMKRSGDIETLKAMCREEQNQKGLDYLLKHPRMRTTGQKRQQQLDTLNMKALNVSLTEQHAEGEPDEPKPRGPIMCQPRPQADLTPESWLQNRTHPEPGLDSESGQESEPEMSAEAQDIVIDIEFDDSERVDDDIVYKGRIIPLSEIEEAKQKLLKESEEAERKLLTERYKTERRTAVEELKKQHKQFLGDDNEACQEVEDDQAERSVDKVGREELFRDEAEKKAFIKKSKRRRAVYWINKMVRKNHEEMIKTYMNVENKGKRLDNRTNRAEYEQEKRASLLRTEEKRKRSYEEGLQRQKEKSLKKQANRRQNTEKSSCQSYSKENSE